EISRLCRGGSKSLTSSVATVGWPGKDPSPVPRPLVKARGAVHPLPLERASAVSGALPRAMTFSLSLGERVAEGRGRVRGLFRTVAVRRYERTTFTKPSGVGDGRREADRAGHRLDAGPRRRRRDREL